jgi:hypothetical protein
LSTIRNLVRGVEAHKQLADGAGNLRGCAGLGP